MITFWRSDVLFFVFLLRHFSTIYFIFMSFSLARSCISVPSVVSVGLQIFYDFLFFFHFSANTWPIAAGHRGILLYSIFIGVFPLPSNHHLPAVPRCIQYNTLVFHRTSFVEHFLLIFFVTFLNVNRFFTCHRVCIWSLFQVSYFFYIFIFIVYYCIFKDIISNILVRHVKCKKNKFVPGIKIVFNKNFVTKKKKN